jgi:acetolactate synthase-1/2/3 large subunit
MKNNTSGSVAAAYLTLLASRNVDYLFGNAGTDFAPIIEAYADLAQKDVPVPVPILASHENLAVTMAHGYGMISRRIPAVMVHVSVGTANTVCAAINAARENVGILLTAGRTPITEQGRPGSRDAYIHWSQEMYDQAGMLREIVKWDYELRGADQLETVVDRAIAIAASEPRGPVYLSLPREILAADAPPRISAAARLQPAPRSGPDPASIEAAAQLLANAARPMIVTCNAGREPSGFAALSDFAQRFAVPVIQHKPRYFSIPSSHEFNLGYEPRRLIAEADLVLAIECDVPWMPVEARPADSCRIIQAGVDPLHSRIPVRGFASDVTITGDAALVLADLSDHLDGVSSQSVLDARREWVKAHCRRLLEEVELIRTAAAKSSPVNPAWASHCIDRAKDERAIVVNEYTLMLDHCRFEKPDCYFGSSAASGLGWGPGAALGAKLAAPDRQVIAVLGDGAYLFSNPVAVHHAAALHELPVLFVVLNNAMWGAVQRATNRMYPKGSASKRNDRAFTRLDKLPAFEQVCAAAGGYGERVEHAADLAGALQRALSVIKSEKRQALLNVICQS